jgi:O-antigen/teichoic acid export membrane protein
LTNAPTDKTAFLRNSALSLLSWLLPICLAFLATPLIVRGLGNEQYGVYALILGFLSFAFTNGIGKVAAKYVAEYRASGESEKLSQAVAATFRTTLIFGLVEAGILAFFGPMIASDLLRIDPAFRSAAITAIYLAAAAGFIGMMGQVAQYILQGLHRFDIFSILTNVNGALLAGGNVLLVVLGYGVVGLLAWNLAVSVFVAGLFYFRAAKLLPEFGATARVSRPIGSAVLGYASSIMAYQLLTSALVVFERTWIAREFGVETVTFYVVPIMLALYMHGFLGSFVQVLFPVVNETLGDRDKLLRIYFRATRIIVIAVVFIVVSYAAAGRPFLGVWIDEEFAARSYWLLVILATSYGLNAVSMLAWLLAEAFRRPGLNALSTALATITAIPLMMVLSTRWASEGVAAGRLAGVIITVPILFYIERRFLGRIFWSFWMLLLLRVALAALGLALVEMLLLSSMPLGWPTLIVSIVIGSIVFAALLVATGLIDRRELKDLADPIMARFSGSGRRFTG